MIRITHSSLPRRKGAMMFLIVALAAYTCFLYARRIAMIQQSQPVANEKNLNVNEKIKNSTRSIDAARKEFLDHYRWMKRQEIDDGDAADDNEKADKLILFPQQIEKILLVSTTKNFTVDEQFALSSWILAASNTNKIILKDPVHILLFVDNIDLGQVIQNFAASLKTNHSMFHVDVQPSSSLKRINGRVLVNSLFDAAENKANNINAKWIIFINSDIIVPRNLYATTAIIPRGMLASGMRLDCDIQSEHSSFKPNLDSYDIEYISKSCKHHGTVGKDIFIFAPGFFKGAPSSVIPPFYIGIIGWDDWIFDFSFPNIVDLSPVSLFVHLNSASRIRNVESEETKKNQMHLSLAKKSIFHNSFEHASYLLCPLNNGGIKLSEMRSLHVELYKALKGKWLSPRHVGKQMYASSFGCRL